MKFFLDTGNLEEIKYFKSFNLIDGVTTNPSIISKTNKNFESLIKEICDIVDGPVSAEVVGNTYEEMIEQGARLSKIDNRIVVKLPATLDGFRALDNLKQKKIPVNFTVIYTVNQAIIAAKLGAKYVSPFVGRLDANGQNGSSLIKEIKLAFRNMNTKCEILAASMRNVVYAKQAILDGANLITVTPEVLKLMMFSELSEVSVKGFLDDWSKLDVSKKGNF